MRLYNKALAQLTNAQPTSGARKLKQHVIPRQRRLASSRQPLFDGSDRQRVRAK
jgi:hypothetical protein